MRRPGPERGPAPAVPGAREPHWAEAVARRYLEARGMRHLASNYRIRGGELDLLMLDGGAVVVVEVKQRKDSSHGHPAEALDRRKLARLRLAAQHYLAYELGHGAASVRLDAVLVHGTESGFRLEHRENLEWSGG